MASSKPIRNFTPDPSPARIVLLVDNSLTIRADVEKLERAAREFAYEIFEGDKLLIVGYDEESGDRFRLDRRREVDRVVTEVVQEKGSTTPL